MNILKVEDAINNIMHICNEKNLEFNGFCNKYGEKRDWYGYKTYLSLKCNKCGHIWYTTTYNNLMHDVDCPICSHNNLKQKLLEQVLDNINKKCIEKNYVFIGFCSKDGIQKEWRGTKTYLHLKCNKCGNEWTSTTYDKFMMNRGCPQCKTNKIKESKTIKYTTALYKLEKVCSNRNYEVLEFINGENKLEDTRTKIRLKCNNCGNIWIYNYNQLVNCKRGCPKCKISTLEREIYDFLIENNLDILHGSKSILKNIELDYFIPSKNIAIECQGEQHFKPVRFGGMPLKEAQKRLEEQIQRDEIKRKLCEENGIRLLYYSNLHIDYPYKVYEDKDELLKAIKGEET